MATSDIRQEITFGVNSDEVKSRFADLVKSEEALRKKSKELTQEFFASKQNLQALQAALGKQQEGTQAFRLLTTEVKKAQREYDGLKGRIAGVRQESINLQQVLQKSQQSNLLGGIAQAASAKFNQQIIQQRNLLIGLSDAAREAQAIAQRNNLLGGISQAATAAIAARPEQQLASDRETLGIRAHADLRKEIDLARAAYERLRASGKLTFAELVQAQDRYQKKVAELKTQFNGFKPVGVQLMGLFRSLIPLLGLATGLSGIKGLIDAADQYKLIDNRLKSMTKNGVEFNQVQKQLLNTAKQTGEAYQVVVNTFATLAPVLTERGASNAQVASLADTLVKSIKLSGGGQAEIEAVGGDIAEGLTKGVIDSRALKHLREQAPELFKVLVEGSGKSALELQSMAEKGRLTIEQVIGAISKGAPEIQRRFDELPPTVGQALGRIGESFKQYIANVDSSFGVTDSLAKILAVVAKNIDLVAKAFAGLVVAGGANVLLKSIAAAIPATSSLNALFKVGLGLLGRMGIVAALVFGLFELTEFLKQFAAVRQLAVSFVAAMLKIGAEFEAAFLIIPIRIKIAFVGLFDDIKKLAADFLGDMGNLLIKVPLAIAQSTGKSLIDTANGINATIGKDRKKLVEENNKLIADLKNRKKQIDDLAFAQFQDVGKADAGFAGETAAPGVTPPIDLGKHKLTIDQLLKQLTASAEAANKIFDQALKAAQEDLAFALEHNLTSYRTYYEEQAQLESQNIQRQIDQKKAQLNLTQDLNDRKVLVAEITALEAELGRVTLKADRDIQKAEKDLAIARESQADRVADLEGKTRLAQSLLRELAEQRAKFVANNDTKGIELIDRRLELENARSVFDDLEKQAAQFRENQQIAQERVSVQTQTGLLTEHQGRLALIALNKQSAADLQALIPDLERQAAILKDPRAAAQVEQLKLEIQQLGIVVDEVSKQIEDSLRSGFSDAFLDIINGTKSIGDAFNDLMNSLQQSILRALTDDLADQVIGSLKSVFKTGSGGLFAGVGTFFSSLFAAGTNHTGGLAGTGLTRQISPLAFAGAPRMHSGGIAGLRSDEVPAILQRGEEVLTRKDPRHRLNAGMSSPVNVTIVAKDADSFRTSITEIGASIGDAVRRGQRNR